MSKYIHKENKYNIFIQIAFFAASFTVHRDRGVECKALFQMKQMRVRRPLSKIGSSAKRGLHQHNLLIHIVSQ